MENAARDSHAAPQPLTTVLRLLLGAAFLMGILAVSGILATSASAGAVDTVIVNSTANTDDGDCEGPPNDTSVGNCTLREAINHANAGFTDVIMFHPAIFPESDPGIILLELGFGALPAIFHEITIDAKGVGVILDGDFDDDGAGVPWGILVTPTHNGWDFELNGGGNTFIIRDIGCDANGTRQTSGFFAVQCVFGSGQESIAGPVSNGVGLVIAGICDFNGIDSISGGGALCCNQLIGSVSGNVCCPPDNPRSIALEVICPPETRQRDSEVAGPPVGIGGPFSLGDIIIDGIEIHNAMSSDGIVITGTNLNNGRITDSWIEADLDGIQVFIDSTGAPDDRLTNNSLLVNRNLISGGFLGPFVRESGHAIAGEAPFSGNGVDVDFCCDLGSKITVDVSNNDAITGNFGNGVWITYCWFVGGCAPLDDAAFNFTVNDNGKISGSNDAVNVDLLAGESATDDVPATGSNLNVDVQVNRNDKLDAEFDDGVDVEIDICCSDSDSVATVAINENDDIVGDDKAVDVDQLVCCGADNESHTTVDDNEQLTGEGDEGVDIDVHAGSEDTPTDSDENLTTVSVSRNEEIVGEEEAIKIDASSGKLADAGDADRNTTTVTIAENEDSDSADEDGIEVNAYAGTQGGPGDADDNTVTVNITGNDDVDGGDDDGVDVFATAGADRFGPDDTTGDGNTVNVIFDENDDVVGHSGHAVVVEAFAGGASETGEGNSTSTSIRGNDDLNGRSFQGDAVHTENAVCCDADGDNTNHVEISGNDNLIGNDGDGIDIHELCCTLNTVSIKDNDNIRGNEEEGIEITPCFGSGDFDTPSEVTLEDVTCMGESVTILNIMGNSIFNSGQDGIAICCGLFQLPVNQAPAGVAGEVLKSVIAENEIAHNGEDGIDLDSTVGINIERNTIYENGTSAQDGDNGIEIDWTFAHLIWDSVNNIPGDTFKVPAHFNRISENSTYDNVGLGINLIGTVDDPGPGLVPGSGTEFGVLADGVGCDFFPLTPLTANDCVPYPKLLFLGGPGNKLQGATCALCRVEVFIADPIPEDQTGPFNRQHGEGRTFVIAAEADDLGDFTVALPCGMLGGMLTGTATDKLKNTSEFGENAPFPGTPACAAATAQPDDTPGPQPTGTPDAPAPTATAVPPTAGPAGVCGDVNSDGVANTVDATLILQLAAGIIGDLPKGNAAGDVNNDGVTNSIDANLILQSTASMIAGLNCG